MASESPVTPDIGTTISDGYSRGMDRFGAIAGATIVPVLVVGAVYGIVSWLQSKVVTSSVEDVFEALRTGGSINSFGDRAVYNLLAIVAAVVGALIGVGLVTLIAGAFHRERRGEAFELPGPGESLGAVWASTQLLLPRYWILVLLSIAGSVAAILATSLGSLVDLVAGILSAWLAIRWVYAPVIAGGGEATGDAAFDRSEQAVEGAWWRTLGIYIVIALAIGIPAVVAGTILGLILGAIFGWLAVVAVIVVVYLALAAIGGAALESAWAQVSGTAATGTATPPAPATSAPTEPAPAPTSDPAPSSDPAPESSTGDEGDDTRGPSA